MPALFGNIFSGYDILLVAFIAMLLFGKRLPSMMRSMGEGVTEFKKGMNGERYDEEDDEPRSRNDLPRKPEGLENRVNGDSRTNGDSRKLDEVRKPEERPV